MSLIRLTPLFIIMVSSICEGRLLFSRTVDKSDCPNPSKPNPDEPITRLHIPIRHDASDALQKALLSVSDPKSPDYGNYWSQDQIRKLVTPPREYTMKVMTWLHDAGVTHNAVDYTEPDLVRVVVTPRQVTALFGTNAKMVQCGDTAAFSVEVVGDVVLPELVQDVVPFVTGLHKSRYNKKTKSMSSKSVAGGKHYRNLRQQQNLQNTSVDNGIISPKTLEALYNVPKSLYPASQTSQAVVQFLSSGAYEPCDLLGCPKTKGKNSTNLGFFNLTGLDNPTQDVKIVGPFSPDGGEVEASLDIEFLMTTGRGSPTTYWTEARWMYDFAVDFFGASSHSDVVSMSYSWSEAHQCTQPTGQPNPTCTENKFDSATYVARTNDEFAKIGLLGVTLVSSSGDDGALGNFGNCTGDRQFDPLFPASSPWVTVVGGTMLSKSSTELIPGAADCPDVQLKCGDYCGADSECPLQMPCAKCIMSVWACGSGCGDPCKSFTDCVDPNCALCHKGKCAKDVNASRLRSVPDYCPTAICVQNGGCATSTKEVVCTHPQEAITSGGGFSAFTPMPPYQANAVNNYTTKYKSSLPPATWFNASNRGYPDLAAVSANYGVWMAMWMPTDGTSASAPVMAGFLTLLNSYRVANGKKKLGFFNPLLYVLAEEHPEVFRDVTEGSNECSSTCCGPVGYSAQKGWDPVTGFGSIDVGNLMKVILNY